MTKLNHPHGIEVGSKVRVLNCEGSTAYRHLVGQVVTVTKIEPYDHTPAYDLIYAGDVTQTGQHPHRYALVDAPNGVNANGEALYFSEGDLKPFQRVVTRTGRTGIIVPSPQHGGKLVTVYTGINGYDNVLIGEGSASCEIVEVYAPTAWTADLLTPSKIGKLVWKASDLAKLAEIQKAENAIAAAEAALAKAKAERSAL